MSATSRVGRVIRCFSPKATTDALGVSESQTTQRIPDGLQVSSRQMEILGSGLQIAVPKQDLDGP